MRGVRDAYAIWIEPPYYFTLLKSFSPIARRIALRSRLRLAPVKDGKFMTIIAFVPRLQPCSAVIVRLWKRSPPSRGRRRASPQNVAAWKALRDEQAVDRYTANIPCLRSVVILPLVHDNALAARTEAGRLPSLSTHVVGRDLQLPWRKCCAVSARSPIRRFATVDQTSRQDQIAGAEAFGEFSIGCREQIVGIDGSSLVLPQAGEAHGGTEFP